MSERNVAETAGPVAQPGLFQTPGLLGVLIFQCGGRFVGPDVDGLRHGLRGRTAHEHRHGASARRGSSPSLSTPAHTGRASVLRNKAVTPSNSQLSSQSRAALSSVETYGSRESGCSPSMSNGTRYSSKTSASNSRLRSNRRTATRTRSGRTPSPSNCRMCRAVCLASPSEPGLRSALFPHRRRRAAGGGLRTSSAANALSLPDALGVYFQYLGIGKNSTDRLARFRAAEKPFRSSPGAFGQGNPQVFCLLGKYSQEGELRRRQFDAAIDK